MHDATQDRFARTADRIAALQDTRAAELETKVVRFLAPAGDERALDSGSGAGALAFALAPHVREVVAVDLVPELLAQGRRRAEGVANVEFVEGDATALSFERAWFDLAGSLRTLHHLARPELAVAELARVTRPGGRVLVVDQIAPVDPEAAAGLDAFERARDPSHARALPDIDLRHLFEANGLVLLRNRYEREPRDLEPYLDLAGCEEEARERAERLAPRPYVAELGWYLLDKRF
jgi:ubiquinone/menaquinone biosynthesis C-methylase UbiE